MIGEHSDGIRGGELRKFIREHSDVFVTELKKFGISFLLVGACALVIIGLMYFLLLLVELSVMIPG